jgi:helix-turn-helix protein
MPADDGLHGMPAEDLAAFLRDLRALRVREGLSLDGLAARADIPPDTLAAAENGPVRPAMPVLEAYVRGCGDSTETWRGRWHGLASGTSTESADRQPAAAGPAGQPEFAITRLGQRPGRWRPSPALAGAVAAAVALAGLAAGGAFLLPGPAGHDTASAPAAPSRGNGRSMAASGGRMRMRTVTPGPAQPSAGPARPGLQRARMPGRGRVPRRVPAPGQIRPAGARLEVPGVGCPDTQGGGVSLAAATTGPGWITAGGGWAGNGCGGSSVWTMDPNGTQASPSTLTWFFHPGPGTSACRLTVFVPTQNALGVASYEISAGGASLGSVSVDQAVSAGQWITLGSYPVAGGTLDVRLLPGTATLTAAPSGRGGSGQSGDGGNGNSGGGKGGPGATGQTGTAPGRGMPTARPAPGHNAAVAASAASATCT